MSVESERSIGERAVAKGWLLPADLQRALLIRRNARNATLDEILVEHGILSEAQGSRARRRGLPRSPALHEMREVLARDRRVASETRDCKACGAPFGASESPPVRRRFGILTGIGAGALVATAAALAILLARKDPPPPARPLARALPKAGEKPRPPEPVPLAERIAALSRREGGRRLLAPDAARLRTRTAGVGAAPPSR